MGMIAMARVALADDAAKERADDAMATAFRQHCLRCHSGETLEGGFDMGDLLAGSGIDHNVAGWHAVLERVAARDMPPADESRRPTEEEYRRAEAWLRGELASHEARAAGSRPRPLRRLNTPEFDRSLQAVFGLPGITPGSRLPPDDAFDGFTNVAEALNLSSVLVEQYVEAAEAVARLAVQDGAQPPARVQTFTLTGSDYGHTIRGHDPSGAVSTYWEKYYKQRWWLGDHLYVATSGPIGFYKVRIHVVPVGFAARPGYVPHLHVRFSGALASTGDLPVRDGQPAVYEMVGLHAAGGELKVDFRWANGFPDNNGLRAETVRPPAFDDKQWNGRDNAWNYLHRVFEPQLKTDPNLEYPFPRLADLKVEVEGPIYPDGWPMSRFQRENAAAIAAQDAGRVAAWLLPRLYRRPATSGEIEDFSAFVNEAAAALPQGDKRSDGDRFHEALRQGIVRAMLSPSFLFLVEPGPVGRRLNDHELAARLSYFLWSAPPDEELVKLADAGKLRPALAAQARRMIADERSAAFIARFTDEWLGLAKLATIMPEDSLYPRFDKQGLMRKDFADEPRAMVAHLLATNGSLFDLLDCDYAFLNDRLADHYHLPSWWSLWPLELEGFPPVGGGELRKVKLPPGRRGGLVTTAAFLATTSENTRTSPVRRGAWILERLFNRPPPPPPPNVNGVLPDSGDGDTSSSLVRSHVKAANCAGCHERFDPFGLALEHYDVIGEWRDRELVWIDPANPARSVAAIKDRLRLGKYDPLPSFSINDTFAMGGVEHTGPGGLKAYLVANKERFARGFLEKLATYALGRRHLLSDEPHLQRMRDKALQDDFRFQTLILALVESEPFQVH